MLNYQNRKQKKEPSRPHGSGKNLLESAVEGEDDSGGSMQTWFQTFLPSARSARFPYFPVSDVVSDFLAIREVGQISRFPSFRRGLTCLAIHERLPDFQISQLQTPFQTFAGPPRADERTARSWVKKKYTKRLRTTPDAQLNRLIVSCSNARRSTRALLPRARGIKTRRPGQGDSDLVRFGRI